MKHFFCMLISGLVFISSYAQTNDIQTSHYLFPEFTQGVILMKDGKRDKALLNYNSLTEEMMLENKGLRRAFSTHEILRVDTVYIKDGKYVVLNGKFVEPLYHSKWELFAEHKCKLEHQGTPAPYGERSQTGAATSVSSLYSHGGVVYGMKLPDEYKPNPYIIYWLKKNGELYKFLNMRELKKIFVEKKNLYKNYLKMNRVKYHDQESIIHLIEYLESN